MNALRLVVMTGLCFLTFNTLFSQVKIGDNPLEISTDRWLEIQRTGTSEFLIVTDSLYFGRSSNATSSNADPLMLKLFGYGLGSFTLNAGDQYSTSQGNVFLAPSINGEVLEVPMALSLVIQDSTIADLSITNGVDTFGTTNLMLLDSIFATDNELRDSTSLVRTLIANSQNSDGDTITGNEYIDEINILGDTALEFVENIAGAMGSVNRDTVDLSSVLGANTFYLADGALDEDRTVTGGGFDLDYDGIDTFNVDGAFVNLDGDQVAIQQDGQDIIMINSTEQVKFRSTTTDSILFLDNTGDVYLGTYGDSINTGTVETILAVDAEGKIIEIGPEDILAYQTDSTIYNNDGVLTGDRTLSGSSTNSLTFDGVTTFGITNSTTMDVDATNVDLDGTAYTADYTDIISTAIDSNVVNGATTVIGGTTTVDIDGGTVTLDGSSVDITSTGAITSTSTTNTNIISDSTKIEGELTFGNYGDSTITGTFTTILGVDIDGNVIEVQANDIANTESDSTIYTFDGVLTGDRNLDGNNLDLTFAGIDSLTESSVTSVSTSSGNNTVSSTGGDVIIDANGTLDVDGATVDIASSGTSTITSAGDNTVSSTGGDVVISSTTSNNVTVTSDSTQVEGELTFGNYGDSTITGTFTTILGVDIDGNVIEVQANDIANTESDSTIYTFDGVLTGDRNLDGNNLDLTFTGIDSLTESSVTSVSTSSGNNTVSSTGGDVIIDANGTLDVDGATVDIASSGTSTITSTGDNTVSSTGGDVVISSTTSNNVTVTSDSTQVEGELTFGNYGDSTITGTFTTILGVDIDGNVIEVQANDIANTESDSTIYTFDGVLTGDRNLDGKNLDLTFTGIDSLTESSVTSVSTSSGNNTVSSTGGDVIIDANGTLDVDGATVDIASSGTSTITSAGDNTVSSTGGDVVISSTTSNNVTVTSDSTQVEGELTFGNYGDSTITGTFTTILGVDIDGNVIEVQANDIANTESDSTIYTFDGILTGQRFMTMNSNDLHFVGSTDTTVIHDNGAVSIGRTTVRQGSSTNVMLDVEGDIYAVQVHSSSDRRFKKDIQKVDSALEKVMNIEGVTYKFRTDEFPNRNFTDSEQLGFIAQDLEKIIPQVVTTAEDGYKAVDYSKVTALLVEAMKDQQKEILKLQKQLLASNTVNDDMRSEMASIKILLNTLLQKEDKATE